jgi:hypothetical protein
MNVKHTEKARSRPRAESFLDSLREFLTPVIWKQVKKARSCRRRSPRWSTQPLILTLLVMTWCCGDSQAERFETAKGFTAACLSRRRRPGRSVQGFQLALARLPTPVLRTLAAAMRQRMLALLNLRSDGFIAFGCDGSSMETPCVAELEKRLDPPLKKRARPQVWVTALVHLRTGVLWAWRLGKGYNRERTHLRMLLPTLPAAALVVADAGYSGYELAQAISTAGLSFLIRVSGEQKMYTEKQVVLKKFKEGEVLLWPKDMQTKKLPPFRVRLIRIRADKKRKDVWLLTNVLETQRLPASVAGRYYRWRWENEGLFRTFKRTLAKVRLLSRTIREIHREAEGALLATQLLLAQGARATQGRRKVTALHRCSPRKVLLTIRTVILGRIGIRRKRAFHERMAKGLREHRQRTSSKVSRTWPRYVKHRPLKPPILLTLTPELKRLMDQLLGIAA